MQWAWSDVCLPVSLSAERCWALSDGLVSEGERDCRRSYAPWGPSAVQLPLAKSCASCRKSSMIDAAGWGWLHQHLAGSLCVQRCWAVPGGRVAAAELACSDLCPVVPLSHDRCWAVPGGGEAVVEWAWSDVSLPVSLSAERCGALSDGADAVEAGKRPAPDKQGFVAEHIHVQESSHRAATGSCSEDGKVLGRDN